eukprot:PITA_25722
MELREEPLLINESLMYEREMSEFFSDPESWYYDIHFYLIWGSCPKHMDASQRRALKLKSNQYHLANNILYKENYYGIWMKCLEKDDVDHVLKEMHDGPAGGHYGGETTAHKILRAEYYWPKMFRYSHAYARKCKACQISAGRERKPFVPLKPVMVYRSFQCGIPDAPIFDNASYFSSLKLTEFTIEKSIHIRYAAKYYPQGNGVAESSNKNLIHIIRKFVADNQRSWHNTLTNSLWANRVTPKLTLRNSPYFLVYGQEAILPPNITLPSLQLSQS